MTPRHRHRNHLDVIATIRNAGGSIFVLDGDLRVTAPPGTLDAEAVETLRQHKPELISILADAERDAIQWVEGLDQADAEIVEAAISESDEITGGTQAATCEVVEETDRPADDEVVTTSAICSCGSNAWRDFAIHNGRSLRRDCAKCRRFISFPVWYGKAEVSL